MSTLTKKIMVSKVGDTVTVGANNFIKRELFGRTEGDQYPEDWKFEFVKDKTALLDDILEGTFVTVHFNLRSNKREKEGKEDMYFIAAQGWKVEV
jgi:hypothetical protein